MTASVAEALARIPQNKAQLDTEDDFLREKIRHVEDALNRMRPGVLCRVAVGTGVAPDFLSFEPRTKNWCLCWNGAPLLSAGREARAEVWNPGSDGLTPLDQLVIKVAHNLARATAARPPMLEAARRLAVALTEAGYPPPR